MNIQANNLPNQNFQNQNFQNQNIPNQNLNLNMNSNIPQNNLNPNVQFSNISNPYSPPIIGQSNVQIGVINNDLQFINPPCNSSIGKASPSMVVGVYSTKS